MRIRGISMLLTSILVLAACTGGDDGFIEPTGDQLVEISATVAAVDWSTVEERTLDLDEFGFSPSDPTFKMNQPYELTLSNKGWVAHNFVAPAFFGAIAVKGLVFADGEASMPLLESIALDAGETNVLIFVPLEQGSFPLICDRLLHETFGMEGSIRIE